MASGMPDDACDWHGTCYGFEDERDKWELPHMALDSDKTARPDYDSMTASEYLDTDEVLKAKAAALVCLLTSAKKCVISTGAGLSTASGIADYASAEGGIGGALSGGMGGGLGNSPFLAQPTYSHRALVALAKAGHIYRWVQQNHDGLPQKAGLPQEIMNEIHGSWYSPDNPVIPMSGSLREDLFADMAACAESADLSLAIGTSISGLNVDRIVTIPADRAAKKETLGTVIIGLQRTVHDKTATLRVFARCDDLFSVVADLMTLDVDPPWPKGEYFIPACLKGMSEDDFVFTGLPYDVAGVRADSGALTLDLRDDAELVITGGMHKGAKGVVCGYDREGNVECRFKLKPERGKLRALVAMKFGRWWIQSAVDGTVPRLPVVNEPAEFTAENGGLWLQSAIEEYAK